MTKKKSELIIEEPPKLTTIMEQMRHIGNYIKHSLDASSTDLPLIDLLDYQSQPEEFKELFTTLNIVEIAYEERTLNGNPDTHKNFAYFKYAIQEIIDTPYDKTQN